jgi:hypothetical protein
MLRTCFRKLLPIGEVTLCFLVLVTLNGHVVEAEDSPPSTPVKNASAQLLSPPTSGPQLRQLVGASEVRGPFANYSSSDLPQKPNEPAEILEHSSNIENAVEPEVEPKGELPGLLTEALKNPEKLSAKDKISLIEKGLYGQDIETQIAIIQTVGNDASEDVQTKIKSIAGEAADPIVRSTAIAAAKWDNDPATLTRMIEKEAEPTVRVSVLAAINSAEIDQYEREKIDQIILDGLMSEADGDVINRALSYFYGQDRSLLLKAFSILNSRDVPQDVAEHMLDLAKGSPFLMDTFKSHRNGN